MHPSDEVLAAFALGEADTDVTGHLQDCAQCRSMVDELTGLIARLREPGTEQLIAPPPAVWTAISAEVGSEADSTADDSGVDADPSSPSEPQTDATPAGPTGWSRRAWLVGGVAAGVLVGLAASQLPRWLEPQAPVVANARLETLDTHAPGGQATVTGRGPALDLTLQVQPLSAGVGFLEVWLINTDLQRMVSVGVLPDGVTRQEFIIASKLIDQGYTIVDISREQFDDKPQHSGDSLLRGQLA